MGEKRYTMWTIPRSAWTPLPTDLDFSGVDEMPREVKEEMRRMLDLFSDHPVTTHQPEQEG